MQACAQLDRDVEAAPDRVLEGVLAAPPVARLSRMLRAAVHEHVEARFVGGPGRRQLPHALHHHHFFEPTLRALGNAVEGLSKSVGVRDIEEQENHARQGLTCLLPFSERVCDGSRSPGRMPADRSGRSRGTTRPRVPSITRKPEGSRSSKPGPQRAREGSRCSRSWIPKRFPSRSGGAPKSARGR